MNEQDSESRIAVFCPRCGQKLAIPYTKGTLKVSCPNCGTQFAYPPRATRKREALWTTKKARGHPLFLGIVLTLWFSSVAWVYGLGAVPPGAVLLTTIAWVAFWFLGVWIMDKSKERESRYYKRWFVILILFIFPLVGITLLWIASRFKMATKIILTTIFGLMLVLVWIPASREVSYYSPKMEIERSFRSVKGDIFLESASRSSRRIFTAEILRPRTPAARMMTAQEIDKKWGACIVLIEATDQNDYPLGQGSGFVVSKDGAVVTNYHVVELAGSVSITFTDGRSYDTISLIAGFPSRDIAILQIEVEGVQFSPVVLGNSEELEKGEAVLAIGNPLGLQSTVTNGIISGKPEIGGVKLLQINAAISPGSSGGALFSMRGEVIGITTLASTGRAQNLNFAVPIDLVKSLIRERL